MIVSFVIITMRLLNYLFTFADGEYGGVDEMGVSNPSFSFKHEGDVFDLFDNKIFYFLLKL